MPLQALGIAISRMPGFQLAPFHKNRLHTIIMLIFAWQKKNETLLNAGSFYLFLAKFLLPNMVTMENVNPSLDCLKLWCTTISNIPPSSCSSKQSKDELVEQNLFSFCLTIFEAPIDSQVHMNVKVQVAIFFSLC
jgi:hypothetical protein